VEPSLTVPMMLALAGVGAVAGCLGSLAGIGGGILVVPALAILFRIDLHAAIATSLVSVVATSTAAGSVYVGSGLANMRLGMALEVSTTIGGLTGGLLAMVVPQHFLGGLFAVMTAVTAVLMLRGNKEGEAEASASKEKAIGGHEDPGTLAGAYVDPLSGALHPYRAERLLVGSAVALCAGAVSGLLGVGGGFLKVPAMTLGMKVPLRVAAATSNFMIGVTAISSLFVYFARGQVRPGLASAVALGVVAGSLAGTKLAARAPVNVLRWVLAALLALVAVEMGLRVFGVSLGG
jgi:uncharacterized membrane protein YfcA